MLGESPQKRKQGEFRRRTLCGVFFCGAEWRSDRLTELIRDKAEVVACHQ
jgi:hypothetical protein